MPKNRGFNKVLGRHDYVVREIRRPMDKKTEVLTFLDFTSQAQPQRRKKSKQ